MEQSPTRQWFANSGITIGDWAFKNGFPRHMVYAVLSGRLKGTRGNAYAIRMKLIETQKDQRIKI